MSIDQQIARLQKQKYIEEEKKKKADLKKLMDFLKTKIGKHFKLFNGASMSGSAHWQFFTITKVTETSLTGGRLAAEIWGNGLRVALEPAYLYKAHTFDGSWSDPQYNVSGGTDSFKILSEGCYSPSSTMVAQIQPESIDRRRKQPPKVFDSAVISESPYTQYVGGVTIESIYEFNQKYIEITEEQMEALNECVRKIQNITWNTMLKFYEEDYRKVWSEGDILAINQEDKRVSIKYLNMLTEALDNSGRRFNRINVLKAFSEFLKTYTP